MSLESFPAYSGYRGGPIGAAYNEAAFRYFLAADQRRVRRSQRSLVLVLLSIRQSPGRNAPLDEDMAAALFNGLASSVREVDFVGWYQHGRVAGAVLPQGADPSIDLRAIVARRIVASLQKSLPAVHARRLHVRVVRLGRMGRC